MWSMLATVKATRHSFLVLSALALAVSLAPSAQAALYYTSGHGDIGVEYEDGELHLHLHLGDGAPAIVNGDEIFDTEYEPDEVTIVVPNSAKVVLGSSVAFLGAAAGSSVWILPASGTAAATIGAPFVGWATEELDASDWIGDLTFNLVSAVSPSGNGNFAVWQLDAFGGLSVLAMSTAVTGGVGVSQAPGIHDHYNIGFTESGVWEITLEISGQHVDVGFVSGSETFTFSVIPEPGTALLGLLALPLMLRRRR